jgi:hypothetical protein
MPEAILTPRATLKWPSRHKHRIYCDIEEALLNIDGDENSNSHGTAGDTRDVEFFGSAYSSPSLSFMGEKRGESAWQCLPSSLPDEEGIKSQH